MSSTTKDGNLNSTDENSKITDDDTGFDLFLRRELTQSANYLDDQGFSAKVLAQIPKARKLSKTMEWAILIIPSLLIAILVLSQIPLGTDLFVAVAILKSFSLSEFIALAAGASGLVVLTLLWWVLQEKSE